MRLISFMLTIPQFQDRSKNVTRRMGWEFAKPGMVLMGVKKAQGLKKGATVERLGPIKLVDVRRERLDRMIVDRGRLNRAYGFEECRREGFPDMAPEEFVDMFCRSHDGCFPSSVITRLEYIYV